MSRLVLRVERRQVLAHRVVAQQLDRPVGDLLRFAVLDLGVQDAGGDSPVVALAARSAEPLGPGAVECPQLARAWATRGAPQVLRRVDLPRLSTALWPLSDADATSRIGASSVIREGARLGLAAFTAAAEAMRDVVTGPMPRGEVSSGVSARVPKSLTFFCATCAAQHVSGSVFQQVGLAAGVELLRDGRQTVLTPLDPRPDVPTQAGGTSELVSHYLHLMGPATTADVAAYLGTTPTAVRPAWPDDDVVEVTVDGRRAWVAADAVDALRTAPAPRLTRLLPPLDPWLQARDRSLLVPDRAHQKALWRAIGSPGAVLVDGEVVGTWRSKKAGRGTLRVDVTPFQDLSRRVRQEVDDEAGRVATARGAQRHELAVGEGA